ncbi:spermidine/putrescine import ATP-binding protein PotA [Roseibium sp. TrichSKD4]|uniref:ABC transporter ATP-binding protein n=1 Tax=Roseibium sp. TrichSKD4 TaxID=744980 RepID=UPI0001E57190|nr:ABC transporter ATP-binding protein [Roseibium sp. TrichSKD4]EFO28724.1 spermidine/putrescine import ATP-binding protein PotA [Roseibium sp. TrichSKD4]
MYAIEIQNMKMAFGRFEALKDINLQVSKGEFVTLLGPSGCGKTTLLKALSGFLTPTAGDIFMGGETVTALPPESRDTALCFQSYALFPHLTVKENLDFGLRQKKVPLAERVQRVDRVSEQLELGAQLDKLPNQLSGGQQQRVALGRALVMQPAVILFDEPLSNLDAKLRDSVRIEIRRIQRENNLTAIYVTHDQAEALSMSDRVVVLNGGRVEQVAAPKEIYNNPATSFVADFIGSANIMDAEVVGESSPGQWRLNTPLGELVSESKSRPKGKNIKVCWRPEEAKIHGTGLNTVSSPIRDVSFQGAYSDLFLTTNGCEIRLQAREFGLKEGDVIDYSIPPEHLIMLEAN